MWVCACLAARPRATGPETERFFRRGDGPFASSTPPATPGPGLSRASPPHTSPRRHCSLRTYKHCIQEYNHLPPVRRPDVVPRPTGSIPRFTIVSSVERSRFDSSTTLRTGLTEPFTWNGRYTQNTPTRQVSHITVRIGQRPRAERTEKPTIHRKIGTRAPQWASAPHSP